MSKKSSNVPSSWSHERVQCIPQAQSRMAVTMESQPHPSSLLEGQRILFASSQGRREKAYVHRRAWQLPPLDRIDHSAKTQEKVKEALINHF